MDITRDCVSLNPGSIPGLDFRSVSSDWLERVSNKHEVMGSIPIPITYSWIEQRKFAWPITTRSKDRNLL